MEWARQQVAEAVSALGWDRREAAIMDAAQELLQRVEESMLGTTFGPGWRVGVEVLGAVHDNHAGARS